MIIVVRLDLGKYRIDQLQNLLIGNIITKDEFNSEMQTRGMDDWAILMANRQVKKAG
jgi:hypothetical protein